MTPRRAGRGSAGGEASTGSGGSSALGATAVFWVMWSDSGNGGYVMTTPK